MERSSLGSHAPQAGSAARPMITVRAVTPADADAWLHMRLALWPEGSEVEHREEIARFFAGALPEPEAVFLAEDPRRGPLGVVELSIRSGAEGCRGDRVAYLEGWFVKPEARGRGVGRALIARAEEWGRAAGCREFASDARVDNVAAHAAHRAVGFAEVGLLRCFRKEL